MKLTFRDACAIQAMQAMISAGRKDIEDIAIDAYRCADAMEKARAADKRQSR